MDEINAHSTSLSSMTGIDTAPTHSTTSSRSSKRKTPPTSDTSDRESEAPTSKTNTIPSNSLASLSSSTTTSKSVVKNNSSNKKSTTNTRVPISNIVLDQNDTDDDSVQPEINAMDTTTPVKDQLVPSETEDNESTTSSHNSYCDICKNDDDEDITLLLCDGCPRAFHLPCVNLDQPPPDDEPWYCSKCVTKRQKQVESATKRKALQAAKAQERAQEKATKDALKAQEKAAKDALKAQEKDVKAKSKADKPPSTKRTKVDTPPTTESTVLSSTTTVPGPSSLSSLPVSSNINTMNNAASNIPSSLMNNPNIPGRMPLNPMMPSFPNNNVPFPNNMGFPPGFPVQLQFPPGMPLPLYGNIPPGTIPPGFPGHPNGGSFMITPQMMQQFPRGPNGGFVPFNPAMVAQMAAQNNPNPLHGMNRTPSNVTSPTSQSTTKSSPVPSSQPPRPVSFDPLQQIPSALKDAILRSSGSLEHFQFSDGKFVAKTKPSVPAPAPASTLTTLSKPETTVSIAHSLPSLTTISSSSTSSRTTNNSEPVGTLVKLPLGAIFTVIIQAHREALSNSEGTTVVTLNRRQITTSQNRKCTELLIQKLDNLYHHLVINKSVLKDSATSFDDTTMKQLPSTLLFDSLRGLNRPFDYIKDSGTFGVQDMLKKLTVAIETIDWSRLEASKLPPEICSVLLLPANTIAQMEKKVLQRSKEYPILDELLEHEVPLVTPLPVRPVPVRDTYGLTDAQFGDVLHIWDFLRIFASRYPILVTDADATGERVITDSCLVPSQINPSLRSLQNKLQLNNKPLPSPLEAANIDTSIDDNSIIPYAPKDGNHSASGGTVGDRTVNINLVDPSLASIADFIAALRGTNVRGFRFLARVHSAILRCLIEDRENTLNRRRQKKPGAEADDADDNMDDDGAQRRAKRTNQDIIAEQYNDRYGERERDIDITLAQVNLLTWPELVRRALLFGPLGAYLRPHLSAQVLELAASLADREYLTLNVNERILLLKGLIDSLNATDKFGMFVDAIAADLTVTYNEKEAQDEEEEKQLREKIRVISEKRKEKEKTLEPYIKQIEDRERAAKAKEKEASKKAKEAKTQAKTLKSGVISKPINPNDSSGLSNLGTTTSSTAELGENIGASTASTMNETEEQKSNDTSDKPESTLARLQDELRPQLVQAATLTDIVALETLFQRAKDIDMYRELGRGKNASISMEPEVAYVLRAIERLRSEEDINHAREEWRSKKLKRAKAFAFKHDPFRMRVVCLGTDAKYRTYWLFASDTSRVYVEEPVNDPDIIENMEEKAQERAKILVEQHQQLEQRMKAYEDQATNNTESMVQDNYDGPSKDEHKMDEGDQEVQNILKDNTKSESNPNLNKSQSRNSLLGLSRPSSTVEETSGSNIDVEKSTTLIPASSPGKDAETGMIIDGDEGNEEGNKRPAAKGPVIPRGRRPADGDTLRKFVHTNFSENLSKSIEALIAHAPEVERVRWYYYDNRQDIVRLAESLDVRGLRETQLKENLDIYELVFDENMIPTAEEAIPLRPRKHETVVSIEEVATDKPGTFSSPTSLHTDPVPSVTTSDKDLAMNEGTGLSSSTTVNSDTIELTEEQKEAGYTIITIDGKAVIIPPDNDSIPVASLAGTRQRRAAATNAQSRLATIAASSTSTTRTTTSTNAAGSKSASTLESIFASKKKGPGRTKESTQTSQENIRADNERTIDTQLKSIDNYSMAAAYIVALRNQLLSLDYAIFSMGEAGRRLCLWYTTEGRTLREQWRNNVEAATDLSTFKTLLLEFEASLYSMQRRERNELRKLSGGISDNKDTSTTAKDSTTSTTDNPSMDIEIVDTTTTKSSSTTLTTGGNFTRMDFRRKFVAQENPEGWSDGEEYKDFIISAHNNTTSLIGSATQKHLIQEIELLRYGAWNWLKDSAHAAIAAEVAEEGNMMARIAMLNGGTSLSIDPITGEPLFNPMGTIDAVRPVFPWNEDESGEKEEISQDPLWIFRSRRRWWRTTVRLATSFAVLAICVLELHDFCADDARISSPPITIVGLSEGYADDNMDANEESNYSSTKSKKAAVEDSKNKKANATSRGRPRKGEEITTINNDDTETEDEGARNDDDTEDEGIVIPKSRTTTTNKTNKKPAIVISSDDENDNDYHNNYIEDDHEDECYMCGKGGGNGSRELILCDGCPHVSHVSCAGLRRVPQDDWFCDECHQNPCNICKKLVKTQDSIVCGPDDESKSKRQGCGLVYHLKCVKLKSPPKGDWFCDRNDCKKK